MIKLFAVGVAAVALSATAAAAATVVDFEGVPPGVYGYSVDGVFLTPGTVTGVPGGQGLALFDFGLEPGGYSEFYLSAGPLPDDPVLGKVTRTAAFESIDVFLPNGGSVQNWYGKYTYIDPGVWTSVTVGIHDSLYSCRYGCKLTIRGGGAIVDNVAFTPGIAPVPEPATWAMMIVGFGLVGSAVRTRRQSARPSRSVSAAPSQG